MFRDEVIQNSRAKLTGNVNIAIPISWSAIGYLLFGGVLIALIFLSLATYARVETASGSLSPDKGVSEIYPSRSGTFVKISVREGQRVLAGDVLAEIRTEEDRHEGISSAEQIQRAITARDTSLISQIDAIESAALAQQAQLIARQTGLRSEIKEIESQVKIQKDLLEAGQADFERAQGIAERGFVSKRDLDRRAEVILSRQLALSQLQQALSAKRAALTEAAQLEGQVAADARALSAGLASTRAQISQEAVTNTASRSYVLRAPISGRVTALVAKMGQHAEPQTSALTIVPEDAELVAELHVPNSAIGFVKKGQEVKLAIDAFPYQRFGTVTGEIVTVATTSIQARNTGESVYPVRVKLATNQVDAFRRKEALVSGMTCSAKIITDRQSLLEWLFAPLFAVSR